MYTPCAPSNVGKYKRFYCTVYCVGNRFLIQCRMQGSLLPKILARALLLITEVIFVRHLFKAGKP